MKRSKNRNLAALSLALALTTLPIVAAGSPRGRMWRQWDSIRLKASAAMFLSGSVELADRTVGAGDGRRERLIETHTRARFLGATLARSETKTRIDAKTGRTLEFVDRQPKRARRYRFDADGYTVDKLEPGDSGSEDGLEGWTVYSSKRFENPAGVSAEESVIYDYFSLLMRLDELSLSPGGDPTRVWVATSDGPQQFEIGLGETRSGVRKIHHGGVKGRDTVPTDEIRLNVDAVDPESASDTFLGMRGETEIWIEARSKTLLEIRGKVPKIPGKVLLSLHELL